jgi:T-complex protein 1 subunit gamma
MVAKDVTHPKMRRFIENPRIVLLDCPMEYKKGESQTNVELQNEGQWERLLEIEEEQIRDLCENIIRVKPDIVITEKGVSDLAQHYLLKANITAIRRIKKMDNHRVARAVGATIVNRVEDLKESDVGTKCGVFEIKKIGDEYFMYLTKCREPKVGLCQESSVLFSANSIASFPQACTIVLRGPSKDIINEVERNLHDAMAVARNVIFEPKLAPGGGATEMAIAVRLNENAKAISGIQAWPYRALAEALEVIPRTLVQNWLVWTRRLALHATCC